jgi:exosortase/archaeosortase family protein
MLKKYLNKWLLNYGIKIVLIYGILSLIYFAFFYYNLFQPLKIFTAQLIYLFVKPFFDVSLIEGNVISGIPIAGTSIPMNLEIISLCLGWFPLAAFFSMVWALPVKENLQIKSLLIGLPILIVANFLRLVTLVFVSAYFGKEAFDLFHHTIGAFDLMLLVIILFMCCVHFIIGRKELLFSVKIKS